MTDMVPYVKLTKKQEEVCLEKIVKANGLLKKWACYLGDRKAREFRKQLFKGVRDRKVMSELEKSVPTENLEEFRAERRFIISIHMDELTELDNRTVEYAMLCGFSALARKHARRWFCQNEPGSGMSLGDYNNEAYIALLDAIYGYDSFGVKFTSFAWATLHNRMIYVTNGNNPLCPLTNPDLMLLAKFEDTRKSFNDRVTFDQVCERMGLSDDQYKSLSTIMAKVYTESQITGHNNLGAGVGASSDDVPNDYTALRNVERADRTATIVSVRDAIERADLTDFERKVLETSLNPYYGWQADVARNTLNPNTGEPYTRMWTAIALKNAHEKVRVALQRKVA